MIRRQLLPAVLMLATMTVITGFAYPLVVTGFAQALWPAQADGSIVYHADRSVGSLLIGQSFGEDKFFHARPSAAGYDPTSSGGSNMGPTNHDLAALFSERAATYRSGNGLAPDAPVPVDAITASGSGLDPDISIANARLQADRVADARGMDIADIEGLIDDLARPRSWVSEPRVNVLELNIALEEMP